jgi:hypothetical protein
MKTARVTSIVCFASLLAASVNAQLITIDTVTVGDAGNAPDSTGFGAVSYEYEIGTYEVTNSQYTAFLNAVAATDTHGLYDSRMAITNTGSTYSTSEPDKPVRYISFWDAARFANWLTNGQPTGAQGPGTTEDGMYNLGGVTNPSNTSVTRQLDFSLGQNGVAVASEDEWYKAAYFSGVNSGDDADNATPNDEGYWLFPTQSNSFPTATGPNATDANSANYLNAVGTVTDVGGYAIAESHYGTFDQAGNLNEWTDTIVSSTTRQLRGGHFADTSGIGLPSVNRFLQITPSNGNNTFGFRITTLAPIPEPSAYAAIVGLLGLGLALTRRKGRA